MKIKSLVLSLSVLMSTFGPLVAQSEAGAIFLLISPGARAGGMGEAQVAVANDAYASYWNPAGLGFLKGQELAMMHVNWLPNLADDLYYEFFAYRDHIENLGTIGGHLIFLNLGEQQRTGEVGEDLGTFTTYMFALAGSYSALLSRQSSIGINAKVSYQHLTSIGAGSEEGKGTSTDFGFDIGYMRKGLLRNKMDLGLTVTNIGPKVAFIDAAQADPQPTNLTLGFNYRLIDSPYNRLSLVYDVDKMLVASYADMDWDGDGAIGGYDEDGHLSMGGAYGKNGKLEEAHTDPVYLAVFTSWIDDWLIGGDIDWDNDRQIGGYIKNENGKYVATTDAEYGEDGWGEFNSEGKKEVGSAKDRSITDEIDKLVHNFGLEYWYSNSFAIRAGYYYDKTGKISNMTLGFGLRFSGYGFDFGYIYGDEYDSLSNTMRFSLNIEF